MELDYLLRIGNVQQNSMFWGMFWTGKMGMVFSTVRRLDMAGDGVDGCGERGKQLGFTLSLAAGYLFCLAAVSQPLVPLEPRLCLGYPLPVQKIIWANRWYLLLSQLIHTSLTFQ